MNSLLHITFTSHKEVMFRNEDDVNLFFNILVTSAWKRKIQLYVDVEMSTHVHLMLTGDDVRGFVSDVRRRYDKMFNHKYHRQGPLGEKNSYWVEIGGNLHIQTALSYVLRNPLHHGVTGTPYLYPYSTVNDIFEDELGKINHSRLIRDRNEIRSFIPRYSEFPDHYEMSEKGVFTRKSTMAIKQVEMLYVTPKSFEFNMFRKSDKSWEEEQNVDENGCPPVTLRTIESLHDDMDLEHYLANERGGTYRMGRTRTDFEICQIVDNEFLRGTGRTIYTLTQNQICRIYKTLKFDYGVRNIYSLSRCLGNCEDFVSDFRH